MADFYIDPNSAGGDGTTTELTGATAAFNDLPATLSAGNAYRLKRGTQLNRTAQYAPGGLGTSGNEIVISSYYNSDGSDDLSQPLPIVDFSGSANNNGFLLSSKEYYIIEYLEIQNALLQCIQCLGAAVRGANNIIVRKCIVHDCASFGINFVPTNSFTDIQSSDCIVEDCEVYNCGIFGISFTNAADNMIARRNKVYDCCSVANGWGIWAQALNEDYRQADMTLESGTTYSMSLLHEPIWVCRFVDNAVLGNTHWLTLNTGTPTTPSVGEYGISAGTLYVNAGEAISSDTVVTAGVRECTNILFEDNETYGCIKSGGTGDGYGIGLDELASGIMRRNYSHDNEGKGIGINSYFGEVYGNVAENNAEDGMQIAFVFQLNCNNNLVIDNTLNGIKIRGNSSGGATIVSNNIVVNNSGSIWYQDMADEAYTNPYLTNGSTAQYNCYYLNTYDNSGHDGTFVNADPLFIDTANGNYNLQQSSPCVGVGTQWWGLDPRPESLAEPLPDVKIDLGAYQSTWDKNHPANL